MCSTDVGDGRGGGNASNSIALPSPPGYQPLTQIATRVAGLPPKRSSSSPVNVLVSEITVFMRAKLNSGCSSDLNVSWPQSTIHRPVMWTRAPTAGAARKLCAADAYATSYSVLILSVFEWPNRLATPSGFVIGPIGRTKNSKSDSHVKPYSSAAT